MLCRFGNFGYRPFERAGAAEASITVRKVNPQNARCNNKDSYLSRANILRLNETGFILKPYERNC